MRSSINMVVPATRVELILITQIFMKISMINGKTCITSFRDNDMIENCTYLNFPLRDFPDDISVNVTILDMSNNYLEFLSDKAFGYLPKVREFYMRNMVIPPLHLRWQLYGTTFLYVYTIEVFDVSNFSDSISPEFDWPPYVRHLSLNDNGYEIIRVDYLKKLEALYAHNNRKMKMVPLFNPLAPLTILDLKHNPLENLNVEYLANLCHLQHLNINSDIFPMEKYCECKKFVHWMNVHFIKQDTPIECIKPLGQNIDCNMEFEPQLLDRRANCFLAYDQEQKISKKFLILAIAIIVLIFLIFTYLWVGRHHVRHHKLYLLVFGQQKNKSPDEQSEGDESVVEEYEEN